jgi:uncharacterized protein with HEPN domain
VTPSADSEEYSAVGRDQFMADRMRQDAALRKFEIIVKRSSIHRHHEAASSWYPLEAVGGMRDRLIHD